MGDQFDKRVKDGYFKKDSAAREIYDKDLDSEFIKKMKLVEDEVKAYFGVDGDKGVLCGKAACTTGLCCGEATLAGDAKTSNKMCQEPKATTFKKEKRDGTVEEWSFKCTSDVVEASGSKLAGAAIALVSTYLMMQ